MTDPEPCVLVVEDVAGEVALRRLLRDLAPTWAVHLVDNCRGVDRMRLRFPRYRQASHVMRHVLLADLDRRPCAPELLHAWNARSEPRRLMVRVAVREVEAWLLGDRAGVAGWLQVPTARIPAAPETEIDPKAALLALGRRSRSRRFASEFCPEPGSSASQGPLYNDHVARFVRDHWNLAAARRAVPSLERACRRIQEWAS